MSYGQMPAFIATAIDNMVLELSKAASSALKQLLEEKHLYQKLSIPADKIIAAARGTTADARLVFDKALEPVMRYFRFVPASGMLRSVEKGGTEEYAPTLVLTNVKIFCAECGERQAFSPVTSQDVTNELLKAGRRGEAASIPFPSDYQLFFLAYRCQICNAPPTGFIVRRLGWNLFLEGRSPIEFVAVPKYLPKEEQDYFRDAVIAYDSGKTLAGLFYLRTFIEQFGRRKTGLTGKQTGDEIFEKYAESLPAKQKDEMPSLREWYDKLSEALHEARADAKLFEDAKSEIDRHFDFRRIYRLT